MLTRNNILILAATILLFAVLFGQNLMERGTIERIVFYSVGESIVFLLMGIVINDKLKSHVSAFLMWFLVGFAINRSLSIFYLFDISNELITVGRWSIWEIALAVTGFFYSIYRGRVKTIK